MKIIDISWPITPNITEYKDRKTLKLEKYKEFEKDNVRETLITIHTHTGTHIDSPAHFLKDGKALDQLDLNKLMGECKILDLTSIEKKITKQDLEKFDIQKDEIILLKTKNSNLDPTEKFNPNFVYLEKSGAEFLASKKIKSVGIDYLGIERNQPNHETHKILLENEIPVIEGLRLKHITQKTGFFYCLPLFLPTLEAAPCRAILIYQS
jgi:arylformamidase